MKGLYYIGFAMFLITCQSKQPQSNLSNVVLKDTVIISKDTTISYNLGDVIKSSEGAEAVVHYVNGIIDKSEIHIFGSMGQIQIIYEFINSQIKVTERYFEYQKIITEIVSNEDIQLVESFSYTMDLNGIPIEEIDFEWIDIFQEFKQVVPLSLAQAENGN